MQQNSIRSHFMLGLLACVFMLCISYYFQYFMHLDPCPLCLAQRFTVILFSCVFIIGFIHNPISYGRRIYGLILTCLSVLALLISGRHIWLQHLPKDKIPECGPGLEHWLNTLPPNEVIQKLMKGSGECAEVSWTLAGLSIPEWSFILFTLFLIFSLKLFIKKAI